MPFVDLDTTAIARSLSQIADREGDLADAYFERREEVELPADDDPPGIRVWRDEGFAIRLLRGGNTWLATRDQIDRSLFAESLRQVARVMPAAPYPQPALRIGAFPPTDIPRQLLRFPQLITREIRRRLAGFPMRLQVRLHRRWVRVVGTQLAPEQQEEEFFSLQADMPWGQYGALLPQLDAQAIEEVASSLMLLFKAREAVAVEAGHWPVVLGPSACAVFLHEVVAHALETDTLVLGGRIGAARGVRIGSELLNVLDDPTGGPERVRRSTDDEGMMVVRRWLLRNGEVEQPLADLFSAQHSKDLIPGAGRRSHRHLPPVPRSSHLELLPGDSSFDDLVADIDEGLFLPEVAHGSIDPLTGRLSLRVPCGLRIRNGEIREIVGPCRLTGQLSDLLSSVTGVGSEVVPATGAGWCAKGGVKLPVWATAPAMRLENIEVAS